MPPNYSPLNAFQVGVQQHDRDRDRIKRLGMSPRQLELNRMWSYYCTTQYAARSITWDGRPAMSDLDKESIARTAVLPPGFWDPSGKFDEVPLSMRRPVAPYHLVRVVVNRFTGLLFSAKMHPAIRVAGDPKLQTWIEGLIKSARLWIRFAHARTLGGGMGSVAVTFRFKAGKPVIEVHDPRWCFPTMIDSSTGEITKLEIRYMYPREELTEKGTVEQVWYWYRRVIDAQRDVLFKPAPVGDGDEPIWVTDIEAVHGFDEFPGVWIRNSQTEDQDGEPDCIGEYDTVESIDRLLSQADTGSVENCDPTLLLTSDELKIADVKKGSRNAIKLEKGGGGNYIEMTGAGVEAALKVADVHRRNFLEVVQCILDSEATDGSMTATEIERRYSSMHERGDLFREQYGEQGVKPLLTKIIRACIKMRTNGPIEPTTGLRLVGTVSVPPLRTTNPEAPVIERELPSNLAEITDDMVEMTWPEWIKRGPTDATAAAGAVATARSARAIDQESAVQYLAPFFNIDDPAEALARLQKEGGSLDDELMKALIKAGAAPAGSEVGGKAPPGAPGSPPPPHAPPGQPPPTGTPPPKTEPSAPKPPTPGGP